MKRMSAIFFGVSCVTLLAMTLSCTMQKEPSSIKADNRENSKNYSYQCSKDTNDNPPTGTYYCPVICESWQILDLDTEECTIPNGIDERGLLNDSKNKNKASNTNNPNDNKVKEAKCDVAAELEECCLKNPDDLVCHQLSGDKDAKSGSERRLIPIDYFTKELCDQGTPDIEIDGDKLISKELIIYCLGGDE